MIYIDEEETPESDKNTIRDTINYPAGCTVIALAQIVAHNKINRDIGPSKIGATVIDWTNIKSIIEKQNREHLGLSYTSATQDENDALADYCKAIADKVVTKYSPDGTSSNIWQARWLLNDFDNYCNFNIAEYDSAEIRTMITEYQLPAYVRGACTECNGGHAWIIDGLYQMNLIRTIITTETNENGAEIISSRRTILKTSELVHCNWGWDNNRDGWFEHMVFKSPTPIIGTAQAIANTRVDCVVDNYSDNVKMLTYNL